MVTGSPTSSYLAHSSLQHGLWVTEPTNFRIHQWITTRYAVLSEADLFPSATPSRSSITHVDTSSVPQTIGFAIFGLYIAQVTLGAFIHFVRIRIPFPGYRPPQNYFHPLLGLAILAMANYQVRRCLCTPTSHSSFGNRFTMDFTFNGR